MAFPCSSIRLDRRQALQILSAIPVSIVVGARYAAAEEKIVEAPSPPLEFPPDPRPVAYVYRDFEWPCPVCEAIDHFYRQLPVRIEWRDAPLWVTEYPTFHWQGAEEWLKLEGWPGLRPFTESYEDSHPDRSVPADAGPFYEYTLKYNGPIWSHPGEIYEHLREDMVYHGFSPEELAGLSELQLERLHSAHHEGLLTIGEPPPEVVPVFDETGEVPYVS